MQISAAVVHTRGGAFALQDLALADPGPGQIRVRIHAAGICHTDLTVRDHEFGTPLPMVLGHEGAGIVEAIGDGVTRLSVGDAVVLSYASCGHCGACTGAAPQYCTDALKLNWGGHLPDGRVPFDDAGTPVFGAFFNQSSFATHALADEHNAVRVPAGTPWELLAPLGCGMMTGAGTVLNTLRARPGQSLVVFGTGSVGLAAVMAGKAAGVAPLVAVDLVDARLALARELGATHVLRGDRPDLSKALRAVLPAGADLTLETTGVPAVIRAAIEVLGKQGTCALVAVVPPGIDASFGAGSLIAGKTVTGAIEGDASPHDFVPRLLGMHAAGQFPLERLVTRYPFHAINEAVADMQSGRVVKPVLMMETDA